MGTVDFSAPSRHLTVAGATGSLAYLRRAVAGWERLHPGYTVSISGGGSIAGLVEVSQGRINIGISDVTPKNEWTGGAALFSKPLGQMPLLMIARPDTGVKNVSLSQLRDMFTGRIRSWKNIGGKETPVIVVSRPLASGALEVLRQQVLQGKPVTSRAIVQLSNGAVLAAVKETPGALGFVESGRLPKMVEVLRVGSLRYSPDFPYEWPYHVVPTLYWHRQSGGMTRSLVDFLATRPYRSQYGLFPLAS